MFPGVKTATGPRSVSHRVSKQGDRFVINGLWPVQGTIAPEVRKYLNSLVASERSMTFMQPIETRILRENIDPRFWAPIFGGENNLLLYSIVAPTEDSPRPVAKSKAEALAKAARSMSMTGLSKAVSRLSRNGEGLPPWWFQSADEALTALIRNGATVNNPTPANGMLGYRIFWLTWPMLSTAEQERFKWMSYGLSKEVGANIAERSFEFHKRLGMVWEDGIQMIADLEQLAVAFRTAYVQQVKLPKRVSEIIKRSEDNLIRLAASIVAPLAKKGPEYLPGDAMRAWGAHLAGYDHWENDWMNLAMLDPVRSFDMHPWVMRNPTHLFDGKWTPLFSEKFGYYDGGAGISGKDGATEIWQAPDGNRVVRGAFHAIASVNPQPLAQAMVDGFKINCQHVLTFTNRYGDAMLPPPDFEIGFSNDAESRWATGPFGTFMLGGRPKDFNADSFWDRWDKPIWFGQLLQMMFLDIVRAVQDRIDAVEVPAGSTRQEDPMGMISGNPTERIFG